MKSATMYTTLFHDKVASFTQFASQNNLAYLKAKETRKRISDAGAQIQRKALYVIRPNQI